VTALVVRVMIAVFFGMVSVGRCLAHQVVMASMVVASRADDVRDRLDRPHQQQDSGQHPQQPMRRRSSSRAGSRTSHASLWKRWCRATLRVSLSPRPRGFTGPARTPRYATSDARATGKPGAAHPVLLNGPALQCWPVVPPRGPRPPNDYSSGPLVIARAHPLARYRKFRFG
jgi:hypothetical protein